MARFLPPAPLPNPGTIIMYVAGDPNDMGEHRDNLREWAELVGDSLPEAACDDECGATDAPFGTEPGSTSRRPHRN